MVALPYVTLRSYPIGFKSGKEARDQLLMPAEAYVKYIYDAKVPTCCIPKLHFKGGTQTRTGPRVRSGSNFLCPTPTWTGMTRPQPISPAYHNLHVHAVSIQRRKQKRNDSLRMSYHLVHGCIGIAPVGSGALWNDA